MSEQGEDVEAIDRENAADRDRAAALGLNYGDTGGESGARRQELARDMVTRPEDDRRRQKEVLQ